MSTRAPQAFVLMPYGGSWDPIFEQLIGPALREAGYDALRADTLLNQRNVLKDIVRGIEDADLVIAEVTTPNANVFYELGLAQGLNRPTILIAQDLAEVPFDLRSYRVELYSTDFTDVDEFRARLTQIALEHQSGQVEFGSPLSDFLAAPRPVSRSRDDDISSSTPEDESAKGAPGFMDHFMALEEAVTELEPAMNEIGSELEVLGNQAEEKGLKIEKLSALQSPASPREMYKLVLGLANDIDAFTAALAKRLPGVERQIKVMVDSGAGAAALITESVSDDREAAEQLRTSMVDLLATTREATAEIEGFSEGLSDIRGISRELDRAGEEMASAVSRLLDSFRLAESFAEKTASLVAEALEEAPEVE